MKTHLVIGETDYTNYIVPDSYDIHTESVYESWKDGNMLEHRIIIASKAKGKFKIRCSEDTLPLSDFISAWNSEVENGVVTLGLYVINTDTFEALECYYDIKPAQHIKSTGGKLYDVLEINITQR